jgi:hypothetical protein
LISNFGVTLNNSPPPSPPPWRGRVKVGGIKLRVGKNKAWWGEGRMFHRYL